MSIELVYFHMLTEYFFHVLQNITIHQDIVAKRCLREEHGRHGYPNDLLTSNTINTDTDNKKDSNTDTKDYTKIH